MLSSILMMMIFDWNQECAICTYVWKVAEVKAVIGFIILFYVINAVTIVVRGMNFERRWSLIFYILVCLLYLKLYILDSMQYLLSASRRPTRGYFDALLFKLALEYP